MMPTPGMMFFAFCLPVTFISTKTATSTTTTITTTATAGLTDFRTRSHLLSHRGCLAPPLRSPPAPAPGAGPRAISTASFPFVPAMRFRPLVAGLHSPGRRPAGRAVRSVPREAPLPPLLVRRTIAWGKAPVKAATGPELRLPTAGRSSAWPAGTGPCLFIWGVAGPRGRRRVAALQLSPPRADHDARDSVDFAVTPCI